jgi:small subunit ribosomal protein S6
MEPKRQYESTFIINASLEDAQIEAALNRASEAITRNGGEITAVNKWGRKRLSYPIQKKNNGFYINLEFTAPGNVIPQLERVFLLDENILRYLTILLEKKAIEARRQQALLAPPPVPVTEPPVSVPAPAPVVKEPIFGDDATDAAPAAK